MTWVAMDWDVQKSLDDDHAKNPVPRDYCHEMLVAICVATEVSAEYVWVCRRLPFQTWSFS